MPKRWTQRPPGSTWGDWGDDDELGRINLVTPAKVFEIIVGKPSRKEAAINVPGYTP